MSKPSPAGNVLLRLGTCLCILGATCGHAQAQTCVPPPSDLVSWWRAEGNARDAVNNNDGSPTPGAGFVTGQVGRAFSGVVSIPDAPSLNFTATSSFTVELWAFQTAAGGIQHLMGKRQGCGGPPFYQMAIGGGGFPPETVPPNAWVHLAVTYDGGTGLATQYVNGGVVLVGDASGFIGANAAPLLLGTSGTCAAFAGYLDEVSIYRRALSGAELQGIVAAGGAGKCGAVGGTAIGIGPTRVVCQNQTTRQRVVIRDGERAWDCRAAGLAVSPRDVIVQTITGAAD